MIENRQYQRRTLNVEVTLHSEDNFYAGITGDVSEGGLFVATYVPPPIGSTIELDVALPNGTPVKCKGVVRWVREISAVRGGGSPGCGIQFQEMDETSLEAIRRFITEERETLLHADAA